MRFQAVLPVLLVCAAAVPAWSQEGGAVEQQRSQMLRALTEWDRSDINLERDAFRLPAAEVLPRIEVTEQKRLALDLAGSRYAEALRTAMRARRNLLKSEVALNQETLQDIQRQHMGDAQAALELLDAQARRLKLADRARRDELEVSRTQLNLLREALMKRGSELTGELSPEQLIRVRASSYSDALQLEGAVEIKDPTDWTRSYASLRSEVKRRAGGAPAEVASTVPVVGSAQLVVPSLAGLWVYSNPNAQKKDDTYQWKSAKADISQDGDTIEGSYECTYAVPEGETYNPNVKFSFSGQIKSEVMVFNLSPPLKGWFQVLKQSAGEITIAYFIENAGNHGISFGEISVDSPQRLGRQAR